MIQLHIISKHQRRLLNLVLFKMNMYHFFLIVFPFFRVFGSYLSSGNEKSGYIQPVANSLRSSNEISSFPLKYHLWTQSKSTQSMCIPLCSKVSLNSLRLIVQESSSFLSRRNTFHRKVSYCCISLYSSGPKISYDLINSQN